MTLRSTIGETIITADATVTTTTTVTVVAAVYANRIMPNVH